MNSPPARGVVGAAPRRRGAPGRLRAAALAAGLLAAPLLINLPAATARMPVDEIRRGMVGVGSTVFEGVRREQFSAEMLGVLRNVMGPRRDIIVARLSGGPLADTGVVQGMSGSAVYIDDRLIGAVSYALGSFAKEPIAGITPIAEMVAAGAGGQSVARAAAAPPLFPAAATELATLVGARAGGLPPLPLGGADVGALGVDALRGGALLRPIATPVVLGGFAPPVQDAWIAALGAGGFAAGAAGGQAELPLSGEPAAGRRRRRGGADPRRPAAGGHGHGDDGRGRPRLRLRSPLLQPRPHPLSDDPCGRHYSAAELALSSKIAAVGETVGTLDQDRSTGIFGALGAGPRMIPVRLELAAGEHAAVQTFRFEVVEDRLFTPLLTYSGVLSSLLSWTRQIGASTYAVDATTRIAGKSEVRVADVYSGETALISAAGAVANPLTALLNNDIAAVDVEGLEIRVDAAETPRSATLERVWLDTARVRSGDHVRLHILARADRGPDIRETVAIDVPPHVSGPLQVRVADAATLRASEQFRARPARTPRTIGQLIDTLNTEPRGNRLYVHLLQPRAGAVVGGSAQPALPASVLAVLESGRSGSDLQRLAQAVLGAWELDTRHAVTGARTLNLRVEAR